MADDETDSKTPLTEANIFYDGFAKVAVSPPGPRSQYVIVPPVYAPMDLALRNLVPEPSGHVMEIYGADFRSLKQLVALSMILGRRVDTIIKNNETSSAKTETALNEVTASLSTLARALGVISLQQQAGTDRIVKGLQELKAALIKGFSSSPSGTASLPGAQTVNPEEVQQPYATLAPALTDFACWLCRSLKSIMISRLLQYVASYDDTNQTTATPGKVYADMARDGSFDAAAGLTFTQLVGMAKDKGLILEVTSANGVRYLKLSLDK